ncbi:hypothetical protein WYI_13807 [Ochrobactrum sp. CDB2]|nr:hypothetical protein WYI_13807 [Ochrobactrum sp. CDB2]
MTIPDEAVQAAHAEYHKVLGDSNSSNPMLAALTAALPFLTGVKVKGLEWVKPPLSETLSRCETEFGTYRTWTHDEANGKWFWSVEGGYNEVTGEATDEEAAKAAAQADYEARILSAIEVGIPATDPSQRAQALEEAAKLLESLAGAPLDGPAHDTWERGRRYAYRDGAMAIRKIALSSQPVADGWEPIETAPKDGTIIDLWSSEFGRQPDCFWGKRSHCCGEDGQYCDSDWHSEPESWIDSAQNTQTFDDITHWRPLPASPGASE